MMNAFRYGFVKHFFLLSFPLLPETKVLGLYTLNTFSLSIFFSCMSKSFFFLAKKCRAFPPVLYYPCICIYPVALIRELKIHTKDVNTYVYVGTNF